MCNIYLILHVSLWVYVGNKFIINLLYTNILNLYSAIILLLLFI
jgi:hypothetical protein